MKNLGERRSFRFGVVVGVLAVFGVGLALWVPSSSGSKEAALGTALLSSLVVGVALYIVQAAFTSAANRRQDQAAMSASSEPTLPQDTSELAPRERGPDARPGAAAVEQNFRVEYEGNMRDTSRLDAMQMRLRVFADDDYFQFITAPVPAPELRAQLGAATNVTRGQLWHALALEACPLIQDAVRRREIPLDDRTMAFEVYPDVETAVKKARTGVVSDEVEAGQTLCTFTI